MEKDYERMCANDGWDEIRRMQEELTRAPLPTNMQADIPQDSDYFKVHVPSGAADREVRASSLSAEAVAAYRLPAKPRRNLDELRRVEAATREAVEREKAARAAREPIRCRSEVVTIDSLEG